MTDISNATDRPWFVQPGYLTIYSLSDGTAGLTTALFSTLTSEPGRKAATANAELAIRAVNSYAAMLAALKVMTERYADLVNSGDCGNWDAETEPEVIAARAAIRLAEGKDAAA